MNCRETEIKIEAHLDGLLTVQESDRIEAHVESCASCAALLLDHVTRELEKPSSRELLARLEDAAPASEAFRPRPAARRFGIPALAVAAAALVVFFSLLETNEVATPKPASHEAEVLRWLAREDVLDARYLLRRRGEEEARSLTFIGPDEFVERDFKSGSVIQAGRRENGLDWEYSAEDDRVVLKKAHQEEGRPGLMSRAAYAAWLDRNYRLEDLRPLESGRFRARFERRTDAPVSETLVLVLNEEGRVFSEDEIDSRGLKAALSLIEEGTRPGPGGFAWGGLVGTKTEVQVLGFDWKEGPLDLAELVEKCESGTLLASTSLKESLVGSRTFKDFIARERERIDNTDWMQVFGPGLDGVQAKDIPPALLERAPKDFLKSPRTLQALVQEISRVTGVGVRLEKKETLPFFFAVPAANTGMTYLQALKIAAAAAGLEILVRDGELLLR